MLSFIQRWNFLHWLIAAIGTAIVAVVVNELWGLMKSGALFDWLEYIAGDEVAGGHLTRDDLVGEKKQRLAEWILSLCPIVSVIITYITKVIWEDWLYPFFAGLVYGYAFGIGLLFFLSQFERFEDIHLAIGQQQYVLAGIAIIATIVLAFAMRISERFVREKPPS